MPIEWAGLGPEVLLRLDRGVAEPLRVQLERELRDAVRSGRLAAGERLPSSRVLAAELGISRGLVLECYSQLRAEGFLTASSGSATRVAPNAVAVSELPLRAAPSSRLAVDFRPGVPDLTSFPRRDWAWSLREACRKATAGQLGYGDPRGDRGLRELLAAYLRRVRGTVADAERIVICSGFGQGINLLLRVLAEEGVGRVAIEDPGDNDYVVICDRLGIEAVPVSIDERGIEVDALAATEVRAVILTPTHQFPTGTGLAPERRQALVAWANERDATIIEDDYDAEFRYDRQAVGSLQGLDPERVFALGSVSKTIAPAIRIGWVLAPPRFVEVLTEEKQLSSRGAPGLDQEALALLIESGRFDRHLRRVRDLYRARRDALAEEIGRLSACPEAVKALDLDRMRRLLAEMPQHGWDSLDLIDAYRHGLLRGISNGRFLRRMMGANR